MKILIGTLSLCLGCWFSAWMGSMIVLRGTGYGYTSCFKVLEAITGYLPLASVPILFTVGIFATWRTRYPYLVKLPLVFILSMVPLATYVAMCGLTYTTDQSVPERTAFGHLSIVEWWILIGGGALIAFGFRLILSACVKVNKFRGER